MHHFSRSVLFFLLKYKFTYYLGMVLLRCLRFLKNRSKKTKEEMVLVKNYMGNIKMWVNKNSYMGGSIYWHGFHHTSEILFLAKYLKEDMTFVDVGANQGEFALFASSKLKHGRVLAFEPTPWQLNLLITNVELNKYKNTEIFEYGLFDVDKQIEIFTSNDVKTHFGRNEGLSSIYPNDSRNISEGVISLHVFDDLHFDTLKSFDVLKIDIEGAELPALKGMHKSLMKFKPLIIIEMSEKSFNQAGYSLNDIVEFLNQFGYRPFYLNRNEIKPLLEYTKDGPDNLIYIAV